MKDSSLVQSLIIFKACDSVSTVKYLRYFTLYSLTKLLKLSSTYFSWRSWIFALGSKICFTKCETSYLRKYNFDVYEPSIKKKIKKSSKDYFE